METTVDLENACISVKSSQHVMTSIQKLSGNTDYSETSLAQQCYNHMGHKPKSGVLSKLIRRLLNSKL